MNVVLNDEHRRMGLEWRRDFFQLRAGLRDIAQFQPADGGGEMMAVWRSQRFHARFTMKEEYRIEKTENFNRRQHDGPGLKIL